MKFSDPDGRDVTYSNPSDQKFYEQAAARNWRVRAVLDAFAPGSGRDLNVVRGDPGAHPVTGTQRAGRTDTYEREATPEELQAAHAAAGGGDAGDAAAQAMLDEGKQLREATIILSSGASDHDKLHELGHVDQSLQDPEGAAREAEEANRAASEEEYRQSDSERHADDFATKAKKKEPVPP